MKYQQQDSWFHDLAWQFKWNKRKSSKIQESYKDIPFRDLDIRIKQAEEEIYRERDVVGEITKTIRESLTYANIITKCPREWFPDT